jgi:TolB-like protein/Flp pilus assembly protein TadD
VFGFADEAIRFVVISLAIGFVPTVVLAWIFQFTTEGLKRDTGEHKSDPRATRRLDRAIITFLVLGIAYFAFDKFVLAPERAAEREVEVAQQARVEAVAGFFGERSIAVVPFDNMSTDPEQQYFADGIAEEVLNLLARVRELRVISRSSSFALRGQNLEAPEFAERLNVAHVLEGSVRRAGNRVRVTAQLIEARSDTHLWSKTYEHEIGDVFRIQDEIAADVVANLQIKLLKPLPGSRNVDPEVRSLVEQARQLAEVRPDGLGGKMHELLSRALEIDPHYIPTLNLMAMAYWWRAGEDLGMEESERLVAETMAKVRELDPDSGYLDAWDAWNKAFAGDFEEAAVLYNRSLSKDLTDSNHIRLAGYFARRMGKLDMAVRLGEISVAIDPLCHQCRWRLAESLTYVGDYERARREMARYLASATGSKDFYAKILLLDGNSQEALDYLESVDYDALTDQEPWALTAAEAMTRHSLGEADRAETLLSELIASDYHDQRFLSYLVAESAAWMGKKDLAFERLFEMQATNFNYLQRRVFSPMWRSLHDDPRWLEFREAYGLSQARLDAIEFAPDLPD